MGFACGIVGLPNVGKSTLYNSLSSAKPESANYPFCTIEPNVGIVLVPDGCIDALAKVVHPEKTVPAAIRFVDIAGLVRGASKGEGLGNQFLGHIREVDAVVHVVRCFEDPNVIHVENRVDPVGDVATIQIGGDFRRGALDVDGREVVGGTVVMRTGENAREVIERVKAKIESSRILSRRQTCGRQEPAVPVRSTGTANAAAS